MVIGLVVVSFGTSAPELLVSLQAALTGHTEMSIGNVVGSNIANIALVLGLTAIILPIVVKNKLIWIDWIIMMLASGLLMLFAYTQNTLELWEGVVFIIILALYILISVKFRKEVEEVETQNKQNIFIAIFLLAASILGMYFGADLLVENASEIASNWGVSEAVISVTIIAFGTSVPELATSIIAALKKEMDISIGNIIGSNIFNILSILGITATVHPIKINYSVIGNDMIWMMLISLALFLSILPLKKARIGRINGILFVLAYFTYIYPKGYPLQSLTQGVCYASASVKMRSLGLMGMKKKKRLSYRT